MPENILKVKMLGSFSLQYEGKEIILDRTRGSKTTQLLQLILLHRRDGIAKGAVIDALYGRENVENQNGSLNNTIFRLRKQLRAVGLPESKYIKIQGGMCCWDETIPVEMDVTRFEDYIDRADEEADENLKMQNYLQACQLYTGEFLPDMIGEDWVAVQNVHFRDSYFACLKEVCEWLKSREAYEEIYQLTTKAAEIYPFEDWQLWRIDSLVAMFRYTEAMDVYQKVTRLFFEELCLPPSPEMLKRFHLMGERISQSSGVIEDIKQQLRERESGNGAYFCTLPSFVDLYRVVSRMMERNGLSVYIMLCTVKKRKEKREGGDLKKPAEIMQKVISHSLRKGDFYTRYNHGQYLIMLSGINQENCKKVSERIDQELQQSEAAGSFYVEYYVASAAEIYKEPAGKSWKFENSEHIWEE